MLKSDFNNLISNGNLIHSQIKEVNLFRNLEKCITKNNGLAYEYHGSKGMVSFYINGVKHKCEIADLLLIFINDNIIRFTFMQNKYSRKKSDDNNIENMNSVQHYLLSERPMLLSSSAVIPYNILNDALLPGVGSYGNFSYDSSTNTYDMIYFTAKALKRKKKGTTKYTSNSNYTYFNSMIDPDWHCCMNNEEECVHCNDLDIFESKYNQMMIGAPVDLNNKNDRELLNYIINVINYCLSNSKEESNIREKLKGLINEYCWHQDLKLDENFYIDCDVAIKYIDE